MIDLKLVDDPNAEPECDMVKCIDCDWCGPIGACDAENETESVDGYLIASYEIHQCPKCSEWNTEYEMSSDQSEKWLEWDEQQETGNVLR